MRQVKNATFNKELLDRINRLKEVVENGVSPENIHYFNADLIRRARTLISLSDSPAWLDNTNINSIDISRINQIVRYLKLNKVDFRQNSTTVDILSDENSFSYDFDVPDGFSPKNSFLLYDFDGEVKPQDIITKTYNESDSDENTLKMAIVRDEKRVNFSIKSSKDFETIGYPSGLKIRMVILFWRYI